MGKFTKDPACDGIIYKQLMRVRDQVLKKDRDYVAVYDGEEGVGKSVLAMQHALILDPNFSIDNIVFTSDAFIHKIKDPKTKKGSCILLDEAYNAANSRASLSEVNRAMVGLMSEMRQKNLFVILVLPTFFDLDRNIALWRCRALFHVYFTDEDKRNYVVFDKQDKKMLYLLGKKRYEYSKPKASFPPATFNDEYVVNEQEYRQKKAEAFKKRTISNQARNWLLQRNCFIRHIYRAEGLTGVQISDILKRWDVHPIGDRVIQSILQEMELEGDEGELEIEKKGNEGGNFVPNP